MKPPAANGYTALVKHVRRELQELDFIIKRRTAESYWQIGKFIHTHLLASRQRAEHGSAFYERLAGDVERDATTLLRAVQFYRAYPILAERRELNWNHYKCLITVRDKNERRSLEARAIRHQWDAEQLRGHLTGRRKKEDHNGQSVARLVFTRGRVGVYALTDGKIDFGFKVRFDPQELGVMRMPAAPYVELTEDKRAALTKAAPGKDELYTYPAAVVKILDGDTLDVNLRLGLGIFIEQRLRLRGIDCPELNTHEGRRAKGFVEKALKPCPWIIVKTHKDTSDKYDRYLADIFYLPDERDPQNIAGEGRFLNQELLDNRLAAVY